MSIAPLVPAVAYYRMSSDRQDLSIAGQRAELQRFAARQGYEIIKEYVDEAISGDATRLRKAFQRMIRDAVTSGGFETILCWDIDRFGRFDVLEAGYWTWPLREHGIRLVTIAQGHVNWESLTGRLLYAIEQEAKHRFLRDLSRNVSRGLLLTARQGHFLGGMAPYGFDRMLVDELNHHQRRLRNGEHVERPRNWKSILIPSDDPVVLETARWIFIEYAQSKRSMYSLVDELNRRKIPPPRQVRLPWWSVGSLKRILRNPAYCGDHCIGRYPAGRYHYCSAGEIVSLEGPRQKKVVAPLIVKDAFTPIVDRQTWNRVQKKLGTNRFGSYSRAKQTYIFSRLLTCGHCGATMHAGQSHGHVRYYCRTSFEHGPSACPRHSIREDRLLAFVRARMGDYILRPDLLPRARVLIRNRIKGAQGGDFVKAHHLKESLAVLDKRLASATERLLLVPLDVVRAVSPQVASLQRARDRVADRIASIEGTHLKDHEIDTLVEQTIRDLSEIYVQMMGSHPDTVRQGAVRLIDRITLWFDSKPVQSRCRRPLRKGLLRIRTRSIPSCDGGLWTFSQKPEVHFTDADLPQIKPYTPWPIALGASAAAARP